MRDTLCPLMTQSGHNTSGGAKQLFAVINLGILSIEILLVAAWFINPEGNYETAIVVLGVLLIIMESYRRFLIKEHK